MKIVLLSPAHPLRGGIAALSERLAIELQNQGHEVVIYSFSLQYPSFLFPGKSQYSDDPPPLGLTIKTRLNSINPFNWIATGREIAREKPDVVLVRFWLPFMGPSLGTALRIARWLSSKKLRVTAITDNIIPHEKRPGDFLFSKYFVGACDDFLVMSRAVEADIRQFTKHKPVRFAPHPVYDIYGEPVERTIARQHLKLPETARIALFFGFIRRYKGLDILLEAAAMLPDWHIVVAGECYEEWAYYERIIQEKGIAARVHLFTDFIPTDQVRYYFGAADLVVQPYRTATQSGISQIAYHFETPMVVTRVGGLPEIVTDGVSGYVVEPEPEAIVAALRDFTIEGRPETLRAGVKQEKERFGWGNFVAQVLG